jgi:hypothetical protein
MNVALKVEKPYSGTIMTIVVRLVGETQWTNHGAGTHLQGIQRQRGGTP